LEYCYLQLNVEFECIGHLSCEETQDC
jgi:hypothetical protein